MKQSDRGTRIRMNFDIKFPEENFTRCILKCAVSLSGLILKYSYSIDTWQLPASYVRACRSPHKLLHSYVGTGEGDTPHNNNVECHADRVGGVYYLYAKLEGNKLSFLNDRFRTS